MNQWPTDADVDRAMKALDAHNVNIAAPTFAEAREAMRAALVAGLHTPDTRTQDEIDYDFDRMLGAGTRS